MTVFGSLAIILGMAAVGGVLARLLKLPSVIGYIVAGMALSAVVKIPIIELMGQLGVTLLLFLVGLELPIATLKKIGSTAMVVGIGQIAITFVLGTLIATALGFAVTPAMYIGIALTFGSTVIVVNLLSAKRDLQSLYGRIAIGVLLVQDFVAIGILVVLSGLGQSGFMVGNLFWVIIKSVVLVGLTIWLSEKILPRLFDFVGKTTEVIFVVALAWCLVIAASISHPAVGFTVEIGGFLAGLALANAASNLQIISRVRPLRDFFMTWFFVALGANIALSDIGSIIWPGTILSAFVLIGKPLIVMFILGVMGYKKRVAFLAAVTVAQVSEFSLVILTLALRIGHIDAKVLSLVGFVAIVTMSVSTYLISNAQAIYRKIGKYLWIFERKAKLTDLGTKKEWKNHVVLFGHNRTGTILRPVLQKLGHEVLVVDFDPQIVESLGPQAIYGDVADYDLYDEIGLSSAVAVISTVSDMGDNLQLLEFLKKLKNKPLSIVTADDAREGEILYKRGADYVLVPHTVGGEYLAGILEHHGLSADYFRSPKMRRIFSMS
ncbi:MAG: Transporter, CPA2 family [Candidatus Amesbacteria bacterium GW2011_GWA2_42_12]|uniref:Transporter, CPA2 family n=1 Tax=Candidatus Amesbacteria bacterium GW2011_GWA2_42_12 TaxID=1618356 RepID=A0A0G0Y8T6_9BACT|nr:MAG: Transporter, CPA2 family [Candidatus Amesbacteria bacterium GW2011_GWA2_42_12]